MTTPAHGGKHERETVLDFNWLQTPPAPAIALGARSTFPAALADSWPDIGTLPYCWLQFNLFRVPKPNGKKRNSYRFVMSVCLSVHLCHSHFSPKFEEQTSVKTSYVPRYILWTALKFYTKIEKTPINFGASPYLELKLYFFFHHTHPFEVCMNRSSKMMFRFLMYFFEHRKFVWPRSSKQFCFYTS